MQVFRTLEAMQSHLPHGSCATIGNFDGVHIGHQALLCRVIECGRNHHLPSVAVTFDPHPLRVLLGKTPPFITLTDQKIEVMEKLGLEFMLCLPFTREMAALEPEQFVQTILVKGLNLKHLVIGYDYAFGKKRRGDFSLLQNLGTKYGFTAEQIGPVQKNGDIVSSTRIRELVENGQVREAYPLLGRWYRVVGNVVQGRNRGGRLLGFPTANLKLLDELAPQPGVYAVWAEFQGQAYTAVANIGYNPTFGNEALSVEVHIMDFDQDIYDRELRVHFVERLRSERKFESLDALMEQIFKDIETGREILARPENTFTAPVL
ncbi:MAG: bifunctional riboflavin kinase/FAD synthetase [Desulfohalobium sp.]